MKIVKTLRGLFNVRSDLGLGCLCVDRIKNQIKTRYIVKRTFSVSGCQWGWSIVSQTQLHSRVVYILYIIRYVVVVVVVLMLNRNIYRYKPICIGVYVYMYERLAR